MWQAEKRCSKCSNTVFEKDGSGIHRGPCAWDLDTETIFGDANLLKLRRITACMCHHFVGIVCVEGRGLKQDTTLDVADVLSAEENTLYRRGVSWICEDDESGD